MFARPNAAVMGLQPANRIPVPKIPVPKPKVNACGMVARPLGKGRWAVRGINLSVLISQAWLNVAAEAAHKAVPTAAAATVPPLAKAVVPANKEPAPVVMTTRALRRALDSSLAI